MPENAQTALEDVLQAISTPWAVVARLDAPEGRESRFRASGVVFGRTGKVRRYE